MPGLYFLACVANLCGLFGESEGSWGWFPFFIAGLPGSLVALLVCGGTPPALILFGTLGWYFLSRMVLGGGEPEVSPTSSKD